MDNNIITIIIACFGSTGLWSLVQAIWTNRKKTRSATDRLIMGIGYSKICQLCGFYIEQGYLTKEEYQELKKYLYEPYREMGGNGTCERLMQEVDKLPIKG